MVKTLNIFIGYDLKNQLFIILVFKVILENTKCLVSIIPLHLEMLNNYKETHTDGSNCFIYSRFLIPYLTGYKGNALFIDGDMIVREDLQNLFTLFDKNFAVQVVKHDYKTKFPIKYLGSKNEDYPKKNWSSVILYNCEHPKNKILTPSFIENTQEFLHRFFLS